MGLVLERRPGQSIQIQFDKGMSALEIDELLRKGITIDLLEINQARSKARLYIEATRSANIVRTELLEQA